MRKLRNNSPDTFRQAYSRSWPFVSYVNKPNDIGALSAQQVPRGKHGDMLSTPCHFYPGSSGIKIPVAPGHSEAGAECHGHTTHVSYAGLYLNHDGDAKLFL